MKKNFLLLAYLLILIFVTAVFAQVPESSRSRDAINRVKPQLKSEMEAKGLKYGSEIFILIFKEPKELEVWIKKGHVFEKFKTYKVCTYGDEFGPKEKQGDGKAPEGFYIVTPKGMNPVSDFHLSFNLGYPNEYDRAHKRTGSALMVHGNCVSIGCFAMTDAKIEEIYALADGAFRAGQKYFSVHIFPFRMTADNMKKNSKSKFIEFWENLKEGYDYFEKKHIHPNVKVKNKRYVIY